HLSIASNAFLDYSTAVTLSVLPTAIFDNSFTLISEKESYAKVVSFSAINTNLYPVTSVVDSASISPSSSKVSSQFSLAEINTSTGAPCWICCARFPDPAKLKVNSTLFSAPYNYFNSSIASDKLAAAEIVNSFCCSVAYVSLFVEHDVNNNTKANIKTMYCFFISTLPFSLLKLCLIISNYNWLYLVSKVDLL